MRYRWLSLLSVLAFLPAGPARAARPDFQGFHERQGFKDPATYATRIERSGSSRSNPLTGELLVEQSLNEITRHRGGQLLQAGDRLGLDALPFGVANAERLSAREDHFELRRVAADGEIETTVRQESHPPEGHAGDAFLDRRSFRSRRLPGELPEVSETQTSRAVRTHTAPNGLVTVHVTETYFSRTRSVPPPAIKTR